MTNSFVFIVVYRHFFKSCYYFSISHLKLSPHQQKCRSNIVECYKVECCFDKVEATVDFVAKNGNYVERV